MLTCTDVTSPPRYVTWRDVASLLEHVLNVFLARSCPPGAAIIRKYDISRWGMKSSLSEFASSRELYCFLADSVCLYCLRTLRLWYCATHLLMTNGKREISWKGSMITHKAPMWLPAALTLAAIHTTIDSPASSDRLAGTEGSSSK